MAATKKSKPTSVTAELPKVSPKKSVIRFDATDEQAMTSAYVDKAAIESLGGCENGIRITIEAL